MSLIQLAVLTRSANDAGASTFLRSLPTMLRIYLRSGKLQGSTASQSGRTKGNAASRYLDSHADNDATHLPTVSQHARKYLWSGKLLRVRNI
jgi:hypothetical protein